MKIRLFTVLLFLLFSLIVSSAPFNDGFALKEVGKYLDNINELLNDAAFEKQPGMKGKHCLRLRCENQKDAKFIPVPITAGNKYRISFRTKFVGNETVEKNPTLRQTTHRGGKQGYKYIPSLDMRFLDAAGKRLSSSYTMGIPFGKWKEQEIDFYAPPNTVSVQLAFNSGINDGALFVDDVKFKLLSKDNDNILLTFAPNVEKDGRQLHKTGYGDQTSIFPLKAESKYTIMFKGVDAWGYHAVSIYFLDDKLKTIEKRKKLKDPLNKTMTIQTPKKTKWGKFLVYNHLLESIEIKRQ